MFKVQIEGKNYKNLCGARFFNTVKACNHER